VSLRLSQKQEPNERVRAVTQTMSILFLSYEQDVSWKVFQLLSPHHSKPAMSRGVEGQGIRGLEGVGGV
jgi:hypothetical protein